MDDVLQRPEPRLVKLYSRQDARLLPPTRRMLPMRAPEGVVFHCSDGRQPTDERDAATALRIMQAWHRAPKPRGSGYGEIGYSMAFDDQGNVWWLRGWGVVGSHTKGSTDGRGSLNLRAHGFVYLGDGQNPTQAALEAGAWLLAEHERRCGPAKFVIGHREVSRSGKPCPGDGIYRGLVLPCGRPLAGSARARG